MDVALLDAKIAEAAAAMANAKTNSERRQARERKEDLMRLKRVEQIYVYTIVECCLSQLTWLSTECCPSCSLRLGTGAIEAASGNSLSGYKYATPSNINILGVPTWCSIS